MSRYVQFVTPENVEVSYELAGIGSRFVAALVDHLLQAVLVLVLWLVGGQVASMSGLAVAGGTYWIVAALIIVTFLIVFGYFTAFDMLWGGRSPGKKLAGLRTVRDGGYPIDLFSSAVRNIVRIVDLLPPPYGAGLLSVFLSQEYKRLGDWAAGTLVIKERGAGTLGGQPRGPASPIVAHFLTMVKSVDPLTVEEYNTIRRFVERRHELTIPIQAHIAMRLARPLIPRLGLEDVPVNVQWHYADLLEAIERRYVEEHGLLTSPVDLFAPI